MVSFVFSRFFFACSHLYYEKAEDLIFRSCLLLFTALFLQRLKYNHMATHETHATHQLVGTGVLDCPPLELTTYGKIADEYINQLSEFYDHLSVESYVIMPNHIHFLLWIKNRATLDGQSGTPVPTKH